MVGQFSIRSNLWLISLIFSLTFFMSSFKFLTSVLTFCMSVFKDWMSAWSGLIAAAMLVVIKSAIYCLSAWVNTPFAIVSPFKLPSIINLNWFDFWSSAQIALNVCIKANFSRTCFLEFKISSFNIFPSWSNWFINFCVFISKINCITNLLSISRNKNPRAFKILG